MHLAALLIAREWRHHPWRHAVALLAVALGVALAWSVHLINQSALAEFTAAVRSANGEPDLVVRGPKAGFDDALFARVAADPAVEHASPVVEAETYARRADGSRVAVRVVGVDAFRVAPLALALLPRTKEGVEGSAAFDPTQAFVNAAARAALPAGRIALQRGTAWIERTVAGDVAASGGPLVVLDLAGAQELLGLDGRLTRIDLRLAPGTDRAALLARLALPPIVQAQAPEAAEQRVSHLSRAYRVNLTVLALVALFVGAFLVFSVVALAVAQRTPAFALLGVLGFTARQRRTQVLLECGLLGLLGSVLGLVLGTAMALGALRWLAGDLGGGYFPGVRPTLQWSAGGALLFGALGTLSALVGGWWPARSAERIAPAQALKGLGTSLGAPPPWWPGVGLIALGVALAFAPPVAGLPLAAYAAVAALLFGGVALVPVAVNALLAATPVPRRALPLLAWRRARLQRATATAAVAGVVASLALSVALTVMVASFRDGVARWLDGVLPADLYARSAGSSAAGETAWLPPDFAQRAAALPGVTRVSAARVRSLQLDPLRPAVALIARELPAGADLASELPLQGPALPAHATLPGVFVSEAMRSLHGAEPGGTLVLPLDSGPLEVHVRGVWRDFARQFGSIVIDAASYRAATGDVRINDLALWLAPGADLAAVQTGLRALPPDPAMIEFASARELRQLSLRIFDRSFAVTYYLQAVAIAIGLVGIAASLSAQVLARRKEFGLLAHLGLTRRQVLAVVCGEAAAWLAAGTLIGLLLGLAVSVVLVHVVNPQSFHWTMDLVLPAPRLALLCAAVLAAGVATAAFVARGAASGAAVRSVKEDW
jgi:putative ABC transport system permease protein